MVKIEYIPIPLKYLEALGNFPHEQVGEIVLAAMRYAADGDLPDFADRSELTAFRFIKGDIDRAREAFEEQSQQNRRNANKRWNQSGDNASASDDATASNYASASDDATAAKTNKETKKQTNKETKKSISHGTNRRAAEKTEEEPQEIPSVADVTAYCDANGYTSIDPAYFVDYYDGLKWRIGGSPIYDWRAILRTWVARDRRGGRQAAETPSATSFDTDEFFQAALARSYGGMDFSAEAEREEAAT